MIASGQNRLLARTGAIPRPQAAPHHVTHALNEMHGSPRQIAAAQAAALAAGMAVQISGSMDTLQAAIDNLPDLRPALCTTTTTTLGISNSSPALVLQPPFPITTGRPSTTPSPTGRFSSRPPSRSPPVSSINVVERPATSPERAPRAAMARSGLGGTRASRWVAPPPGDRWSDVVAAISGEPQYAPSPAPAPTVAAAEPPTPQWIEPSYPPAASRIRPLTAPDQRIAKLSHAAAMLSNRAHSNRPATSSSTTRAARATTTVALPKSASTTALWLGPRTSKELYPFHPSPHINKVLNASRLAGEGHVAFAEHTLTDPNPIRASTSKSGARGGGGKGVRSKPAAGAASAVTWSWAPSEPPPKPAMLGPW